MKLLLLFFRIGLNIKGNIKISVTGPHAPVIVRRRVSTDGRFPQQRV